MQARTNRCRFLGAATVAEGTKDGFFFLTLRWDAEFPAPGWRKKKPPSSGLEPAPHLHWTGSSCSPSSVKLEPKGQDCLVDEETFYCKSEILHLSLLFKWEWNIRWHLQSESITAASSWNPPQRLVGCTFCACVCSSVRCVCLHALITCLSVF